MPTADQSDTVSLERLAAEILVDLAAITSADGNPVPARCLIAPLPFPEEPELLMQDAPDQGSVFTNDAISFKIRWAFGGGWLDHRGAFVANV